MNRWNPPPQPDDATGEAYQKSCATALRLLARREHSESELRHKLASRNFADDVIDTLVAELAARGLLSDRRFADAYARSRYERGFGPVRIRAELQERGVAGDLVSEILTELRGDWVASAVRQRHKRFGAVLPGDARERARQTRFLQQRGFSSEQIRAAFRA